jgi:hypothetical protein
MGMLLHRRRAEEEPVKEEKPILEQGVRQEQPAPEKRRGRPKKQ